MTATSPPPTGVAVTAVGAVTAAGNTVAELFDDLLAARTHRATARIPLVANPLPVPEGEDDGSRELTAAHVATSLDLTEAVGARSARALSRDSRLLIKAMHTAFPTGRLDPAPDPERTAVVLGTLWAGRNEYLAIHAASGTTTRPVNPVWGPQSGYNAPAAQLSIHLGANGPNLTLSSGATAGLDAVVTGASYVAEKLCDTVVAAGMDTLSAAVAPVDAVDSLGAPVPAGEAAAVVVLREAAAGGALAYVLGTGQASALTTGATGLTSAEGADPAEEADAEELTAAALSAIRAALAEAAAEATAEAVAPGEATVAAPAAPNSAADPSPQGAPAPAPAPGTSTPTSVGLVVLTSTGDPAVEKAQLAALQAEFGRPVPTCNATPTTGHTGGADGSLAVVVAVEALRRGLVPGPEGTVRTLDGRLALCLSLERGGAATAVVLRGAHPYDRAGAEAAAAAEPARPTHPTDPSATPLAGAV